MKCIWFLWFHIWFFHIHFSFFSSNDELKMKYFGGVKNRFHSSKRLFQPRICGEEQFLCNKSLYCIEKNFVCDGENDCHDMSDEDASPGGICGTLASFLTNLPRISPIRKGKMPNNQIPLCLSLAVEINLILRFGAMKKSSSMRH